MSIAIPQTKLQAYDKASVIASDCTIKGSILNPKMSASAPVLEAFDFDDKHVFLPFAYVHQHHPTLFVTKKTPNVDFKFTGSLLDRQKQIRDQAFELLNTTKSCMLCLHTGFGKTIFALYLASKIGKKTIVLCHRKIIMDQWKASANKVCPGATVGILDAKLLKKNANTTFPDILICNVLNIPKYDASIFADYGLVLCDEIHTMCTQQYSKGLTKLFPEYIIGLSATPERSDGMDQMITLYVGPHMIVRKMHRQFNVYKLPTNITIVGKRQADGSLDWNSVLQEQADDPVRNKLIVNCCKFFSNRTILILVKRKDHALTLQKLCKQQGLDVDVFFGSATVVNYDCQILIATYSKGGVGFDHPKLDMLITGADVEENFMQYLGRIFRRDDTTPIYIDLIDDNKVIKGHSQTRLKICKEIGAHVRSFGSAFPDFTFLTSLL